MPTAQSRPRVGLVGHCVPDVYALRSAVGRALPGAEFTIINDTATLTDKAENCDLLLINRRFDGEFSDYDGVAMIRRLVTQRGTGVSPSLMLVSNFLESQAEAVAVGGVPGFGKTDLNAERTYERLRAGIRSALGAPGSPKSDA